MQKLAPLTFAAILFFVLSPSLSGARQNTLTGGLGASFDFRERNYDALEDDPETEVNEAEISTRGEDDNNDFVITPLLQFVSSDVRDNFEIRIAPDIRYDLIEYDWRWNSDFFISGDRFMTRKWQLEASNLYEIRDYYGTYDSVAGSVTEAPTGEAAPDTQVADPELSPDVGFDRYWRNTLQLGSNYTYKEESLFRVAFDYIVLRDDEDDDELLGGVEDYDRYALSFLNEHRFSNVWSSTVDLLFVSGDFEEPDADSVADVIGGIAPDLSFDESDLSNDINEYYVRLAADYAAIARNIFTLSYNYVGSDYDESLRNDIDIHEATVAWRYDYSPQLYTRLGAGPSYEKTEGQDDKWDWNGIAEMNYTIQHGTIAFIFEKGFTVDNFSGTGDRGFVDFWDARLVCNYDLTQNLSLRAELGYLLQDREDPSVAARRIVATGGPSGDFGEDDIAELEQYEEDRYRAGVGASYTFWRNYTASFDYFYLRQESDLINEDYDDHRILLTVSWSHDLFRW